MRIKKSCPLHRSARKKNVLVFQMRSFRQEKNYNKAGIICAFFLKDVQRKYVFILLTLTF